MLANRPGWKYDPKCDCESCIAHRRPWESIPDPAAFVAKVRELVAANDRELPHLRDEIAAILPADPLTPRTT